MDKKINHVCLILLMAALLSGCKDFIEPSLEGRVVKLMAPADGAESNRYQVIFWWEPVTDALSYRLQIATPDFSNAVSLIRDTLIRGSITNFPLTLEPGKYHWRVRAENGSSASPYYQAAFIIHESALKDQKVTLNSPGNNYLTNLGAATMSWDLLFGADGYLLQIDTLNFANENNLIYNQSLNSNRFTFNFPKDQRYQWRVRAENIQETSKWSEIRVVTFDNTAPGKVSPGSPSKGALINQPVTLSWAGVLGARKYKLYVYKNEAGTVYSATFPLLLSATSYAFNLGQAGEQIFWAVSAIDEAGNEGMLSELMNFTIQ